MGIELRIPNITGATEREQLAQIRSYLYQIVPQLQWALNNMDTSVASNYVAPQIQSGGGGSPSSSFDTEVAFSKLKPLIIKSADIVQAYYEEINRRLEGLYVAESDFGTFMEQTSQNIEETSTKVEQTFSNLQVIITDEVDGLKSSYQEDIEGVNEQLSTAKSDIDALKAVHIEAEGYIKSGELYKDDKGIPVYGVEVGQMVEKDGVKVFSQFARFTANRLSFYDQNDSEVAYISDYKLFIRNAQITSSFKIGGFEDIVNQNNGDVVTKWVGWSGGEA